MDWLSWLSRTRLDPCLVYEYGLALTHNELDRDDIPYFDHEFLQSMGISVAKHRLEILKLARKHNNRPAAVSRLLVAIKSTRRSISRYIGSLTCREGSSSSSALVVVPGRDGYGYSSRWRGAMVKRNKKRHETHLQARLLLTNGDHGFLASPMVYHEEKVRDDDESWSSVVEEIKWDAMFQDLKPT